MLVDKSNYSSEYRIKGMICVLNDRMNRYLDRLINWTRVDREKPLAYVADYCPDDEEELFAYYLHYDDKTDRYGLRPVCHYKGNITVQLPVIPISKLTYKNVKLPSLVDAFYSCKPYVKEAQESQGNYFHYDGNILISKGKKFKVPGIFETPVPVYDWYRKLNIDIYRKEIESGIKEMLERIHELEKNRLWSLKKEGSYFAGSAERKLWINQCIGLCLSSDDIKGGTLTPYYQGDNRGYYTMASADMHEVPFTGDDDFVKILLNYFVYMRAIDEGLVQDELYIKRICKYDLKRGSFGYHVRV